MHLVLLCSAQRGCLFFKKLRQLLPDAQLTVISFKETPHEPPFLNQIKQLTKNNQAKFIQATKLDSPPLAAFWKTTPVDLMLAVGWRYLISPKIYSLPRLGTYVFHDSLLPNYRGFSPTVWAIINGERKTGVTLFKMARKVDSGKIVAQKTIPIKPTDTITTVIPSVTQAYLDLLEKNLQKIIKQKISLSHQNHSWASFTCMRLPQDNLIDWSQTSKNIYNLIRAVTHPYPGAYTYLHQKKLIIWQAELLSKYKKYLGRIPGRVVEVIPQKGSVVLTGDTAILLTQVQLEKSQPLRADKILNRLSQTLK